jgi:pimeloyl-ACP methyl ester carboxylesterase
LNLYILRVKALFSGEVRVTVVADLFESIDGDIHLVGLSMGGKIAMKLAARKPMWLRSLILVAPSYPDATIVPAEALTSQLAAFADVDALTALVSGWTSDTAPLVAWAQLASRDAYAWWLTDGRPADIADVSPRPTAFTATILK